MGLPASALRHARALLARVVAPLRADESPRQFTLSIPEAQTTTVDSVQGRLKRPPAVLECPGCGGEMYQAVALDEIECTDCYRRFREDRFEEFDLLAMYCPNCEAEMKHGRRHPRAFDGPEWATCPDCQFHWDLDHWF